MWLYSCKNIFYLVKVYTLFKNLYGYHFSATYCLHEFIGGADILDFRSFQTPVNALPITACALRTFHIQPMGRQAATKNNLDGQLL